MWLYVNKGIWLYFGHDNILHDPRVHELKGIYVGLSDKSGLLKDMKKTFAKDQEMSEQGKGRKLRAGRGGDEEVEETHSEEILEAISL